MEYLPGYEGLVTNEEATKLFTMYLLSCDEKSQPHSIEVFTEIIETFAQARFTAKQIESVISGNLTVLVENNELTFFDTTAAQKARFAAMCKIIDEPDEPNSVYIA